MRKRRKLIFLGDRKIAWQCLAILSRPENIEAFELSVLVTSLETFQRVGKELPQLSPIHLTNQTRMSNDIENHIRSNRLDTLISVQHNWILNKHILDAVSGNAFNLHNARLPNYKGYNSISHSIINGDDYFYSTMHWMDEEVDSGDIAYEERTAIREDDTAISLHRKTISAALSAFESLLKALRTGESVPRVPLSREAGVFYSRESLLPLLDVSSVSDKAELQRRARALFYPPFNMAYFMENGKKVYMIPESGLKYLSESESAVG